jgi:hypothetical protein
MASTSSGDLPPMNAGAATISPLVDADQPSAYAISGRSN